MVPFHDLDHFSAHFSVLELEYYRFIFFLPHNITNTVVNGVAGNDERIQPKKMQRGGYVYVSCDRITESCNRKNNMHMHQ